MLVLLSQSASAFAAPFFGLSTVSGQPRSERIQKRGQFTRHHSCLLILACMRESRIGQCKSLAASVCCRTQPNLSANLPCSPVSQLQGTFGYLRHALVRFDGPLLDDTPTGCRAPGLGLRAKLHPTTRDGSTALSMAVGAGSEVRASAPARPRLYPLLLLPQESGTACVPAPCGLTRIAQAGERGRAGLRASSGMQAAPHVSRIPRTHVFHLRTAGAPFAAPTEARLAQARSDAGARGGMAGYGPRTARSQTPLCATQAPSHREAPRDCL